MMVLLAIETGLRWGEPIALRPCDINLTSQTVTVRRTIVEVAKKHSPTGERCFVKDYPKDDEHRRLHLGDTDLLFTSKANTSISRNNFRAKFWVPAVTAAEVPQKVTFHNLRAAQASGLLAGGADIVIVQERLGHRQIMTTQQYAGTLPDAGERAPTAFARFATAHRTSPERPDALRTQAFTRNLTGPLCT